MTYQIIQEPGGWYLDWEGIGWILITENVTKPSPEEISALLRETATGLLKIAAEQTSTPGPANQPNSLITIMEGHEE